MSFQPPVPPQDPVLAGPPPVVGAPGGAAPAGGRGLRIVGLLLALLGLLAGGVLFVLSDREPERAVKAFARAPGGCRTTLQFDETGTFTLFVETKGTVAELSGDCEGADQTYDRDGEPDVDLTLIDDEDNEVDLDRVSEPSYDTGNFVGTAVRTFEVDRAGTYRLRVDSPDTDFAIAVGKDPEGAQALLRLGALLAAVGGLLVGVLLWLLGRRRRRPTEPSVAGPPPIPPTGMVYEPPYVGGPPHVVHPPDLVHPPPPPPPPLSPTWPTPPHPVGPEPAPTHPTAPLPQQPSPWSDQPPSDQPWQPLDQPPPAPPS